MGKVAGQRTVRTIKERCDKENPYAIINLDALERASNDLNGVAFKLWIFFAKNQQGYETDMWKDNLDRFGIPKGGSYTRAWDELVKKGYLVLDKGTTKYSFYENPNTCLNDYNNNSDQMATVTIVTKTVIDSTKGRFL